MNRGKYYLSYDVSYYIIDSILRELCITTVQRPQPQLSILKATLALIISFFLKEKKNSSLIFHRGSIFIYTILNTGFDFIYERNSKLIRHGLYDMVYLW